MNRKDYLAELKICLAALPLEEQEEALEYYTDYFEDADDDKAVISELGSPEKLAEEIKEKFACVPATRTAARVDDAGSEDEHADGFQRGYSSIGGLYFEFPADNVKNLDLNVGIADVVLIEGSSYSVETRGIPRANIRCEVSDRGTLLVDVKKRLPEISLWRHDGGSSWHPRILITVPAGADLSIAKFALAAGNFRAKNIDLHCKEMFLDVNAGNMVIDRLSGGSLDAHCGMGNLRMNGAVRGRCNVDCGMGNITLRLTGNKADYSYDARVGLGEVEINGDRKNGVGTIECTERLENHISVNVGMGKVSIRMSRL